MIGDVAQMSINVLAERDKYEVNNKTADMKESVSAFKEWFAEQGEFDEDAIRTMGLDDVLDASNAPLQKHEVYTHALRKFTDETRDQLGSTIRSNKYRDAWTNSINDALRPELERSVQDAANMAMKDLVLQSEQRYKDAIEVGNWDAAEQAIDLPIWSSTPERSALKKQLTRDIGIKRELSGYQIEFMSRDDDRIDSAIDTLTDAEYDGALNATKRKELVFSAINIQAKNDNAEVREAKALQDYNTSEAFTRIQTGEWSEADIIANRDSFGLANYKFLVGQASPENQTFATPPQTMTMFQVQVMQLETGNFSGGFEDEVDQLEAWVINNAYSEDEVTGAIDINISGIDVDKMRQRIGMLRQAPFQTVAYKAVAAELSVRIRGGSEEMIQINPIGAESANLYAEATNSLRNFVDENGGTKADVGKWRKENMPYYLSESSRLSYLKLDREIRDSVIQTGDGKVDLKATRAEYSRQLTEATSPAERDRVSRESAIFDQWVKSAGAFNVAN